jgi:pyruvate kinase
MNSPIVNFTEKLSSPNPAGGTDQSRLYAPPVAELYQSVQALRADVVANGRATMALWQGAIQNEGFRPAAENLAHYLALRHRDLSAIQVCLSAYGLSSLGRSEPRVLTALDAVLSSLGRLSGAVGLDFPPPLLVSDGERALREEQIKILGEGTGDTKTRIMVTLPTEARTDRELVRRLLLAGTDCFRINCAHDDPSVWADMIASVHSLAKELRRDCRVLMDIAGPKCRIEKVEGPHNARLFRGDTLVLVKSVDARTSADEITATISFPEILDTLKVGAEVWINDGKIGARVSANARGRVRLEVFHARAKGARLRPERGVNFPNTELHLPALTKDDLGVLDFVVENADLVGFSFVQRPLDVALLERELTRRSHGRPPQPVVLKIETVLAVENLPQLIVQCAGRRPLAVMIARGDLAVELGFGRLSEIQEEILWLCDAAHVPVIWATQVLDTFVSEGAPTRAEATDAAMSQRAECVMLNKGPYLVEAVTFLKDVLRRMDRHQSKKAARFGPLQSWRDLAMGASEQEP